jgi:hypothetical protein
MSKIFKNASVSFCENKFEYSDTIAEYHNSFSSLFYVLIGMMLLPTKLKHMGKWLCVVGIGAFLLHATLSQWAQILDESAMLGLSFSALKELNPRTKSYLLIPIMLIYWILNEFFLCFLSIFTIFQILIVINARKRINKKNKIWIILYITSFILGTTCWALDQGCKYKFNEFLEPLQLHAWWHFLTSSAIGFASIAFIMPVKIEKNKSI